MSKTPMSYKLRTAIICKLCSKYSQIKDINPIPYSVNCSGEIMFACIDQESLPMIIVVSSDGFVYTTNEENSRVILGKLD